MSDRKPGQLPDPIKKMEEHDLDAVIANARRNILSYESVIEEMQRKIAATTQTLRFAERLREEQHDRIVQQRQGE